MNNRIAKLVCVTSENNNKFYNATENNDGSISVEYGRVGAKVNKITYPCGKKNFQTLINSKLKKGYRDITELKKVLDDSVGGDIFSGIKEQEVTNLIKFLMRASNNSVKDNYLVSSKEVTQSQIDEAQEVINKLSKQLTLNGSITELNNQLIKLYTVLPRKMKNVKAHLIDSLSSKYDLDNARKLVEAEQSLLDTLESQIKTNVQEDSGKPILESMGISIEIEKDQKMLDKINYFLGKNKQYVKNIFKVTNHSTQKTFDEHVANAKNKEVSLLWHGSRNENWMSILQGGLKIRPAGAVITGAMFGNGIYFANRSQKSVGYSSLKGSYWTGGSSNKGFIALFSVHTGESKVLKSHNSSCYNLHKTIGKYDSVFAKKGVDLRNDEIIVYKSQQTTISYIIEMEK